MKKVIVSILCLIFAFSCSSICFAENANLVRNSGFEQASGTLPEGWETYTWENTGKLKLDNTQKFSGDSSICINNPKASDTRVKQNIKVKENTTYLLSCWIRTENAGTEGKGANISIDGLLDTSKDIKGTSNTWEYVELYGKTSDKQSGFVLTLGLGGYGSLNSGTAWFDDVAVTEVETVPKGTKVVKLYKDTSEESTGRQKGENTVISAIAAVSSILFGVFLPFWVIRKRREKNLVISDIAAVSRSIDAKDMLIMLCMTLIYSFYTFLNLGSVKAPETAWTPGERGLSFVVDFGAKTDISRISYFWGLGSGKYTFEYEDDIGTYHEIKTIESKNYDEVFLWQYTDASVKTERVRVSVAEFGAELRELAFYGTAIDKPLSGFKVTEAKDSSESKGSINSLFDEQHTAAYLPTYMNGTYFDEIYHARAAFEYINHIQPYENTHPPLGKVFIALGVLIFGMNPFGWRIVGALFGALMVPLMYVFGKKMFQKRFYAFLSGFLMMFDFMHFTQTRIATIDTYVTFFVILMYYYMYDYFMKSTFRDKWKDQLRALLLSGLCFGLGAASKWIAIYGAAGLAILFFAQKYGEFFEVSVSDSDSASRKALYWDWVKVALYCVLFFIALPAVIYFLSYIPLMLVPGNSPKSVISDQVYMLTYHSKSVLGATHSFASKWWSWPILYKPMWYFAGQSLTEGNRSTIVALGNPAVWWGGIPAVIFGGYLALKKKDRALAVMLVAFIFQYMPWIYVKRLTFIYHFFSSIPFVILIIVYTIKHFVEKYNNTVYIKAVRFAIGLYMLAAAALFVMFYPAISGVEASAYYIDNYLKWFGQIWIF